MQEEDIYKYWTENETFNKSTKENNSMKDYTFYDGPPFATGLPHYGHILAGMIKDTVTRYHHNLGKNVERVAGFDTHGLPIEYEIEKEIKIKTTDEILKYGIGNYNDKCRGIVLKYAKEWEQTMGRLGRWIDFKNAYKTMDKNFMNSVWWVFKQLYDKKRVYEGVKIMPYSTTCGTSLSNFETQQNYQEVQDDSLYICLPLVGKFKEYDNVSIMVWTTTPWTLPANYALCVNVDIEYCLLESKQILATNLISSVFKKNIPKILETFKGSELVGLNYKPPFNFLDHEFKILGDNYVSESDGTGIVHIAPSHGEDDYRVCLENNLITKESKLFDILDVNGYVKNIPELSGMFYKNHKLTENPTRDLNTFVIIKLKENGYYFDKRQVNHNIPFCWRSDTPLIYRAVSSWFVKVEDMREQMVELNNEINWTPKHVGTGRFSNWLANARDWGISRSRFWGTPIPIWKSYDGDIICVGSSYELEKLANLPERSLNDLHRHNIDDIIINKNGKTYKRINDIFDCWFESGAMPYASLGRVGIVELLRNSNFGIQYNVDDEPYIKTTDGLTHKILPADFIAEGIDQTRGWFYTLLVLSTTLFNIAPFKNVIVNGLILAEDGKKMSKRLKNYPDPHDIIKEYGSDCLRLYLLSSPASRGDTLKFSKAGVHNIMKDIIIPLSNTVVFWKEYYHLYLKENSGLNYNLTQLTNPINIWIISEYDKIRNNFFKYMDEYNLRDAINCLYSVVDIINNGYIKLGRNLLKGKTNKDEWKESLSTLYYLIKFIIYDFKSIVPFFSEKEYLNLSNLSLDDTYFAFNSIHLGTNCRSKYIKIDNSLSTDFNIIYTIISNVHKIRGSCNLSLKKPIKSLTVLLDNDFDNIYSNRYLNYLNFIFDECNVLDINFKTHDDIKVTKNIKPVKAFFFKKYGKEITETFNKVQLMDNSQLNDIINTGYHNEFRIDESLFNISYNIDDDMSNIEIKEFTFESNNILLLVNKQHDESIDKIYYYRLVGTSIQKARKNAGLHPWDKIIVYYQYITKKYDLSSSEAIEYIEKIIRVDFKENNDITDYFYDETFTELGIKIMFSKA